MRDGLADHRRDPVGCLLANAGVLGWGVMDRRLEYIGKPAAVQLGLAGALTLMATVTARGPAPQPHGLRHQGPTVSRGTHYSDQYTYQADQVLRLVPRVFDPSATLTLDPDEDTRSAGDPATGGSELAHVADIRRAIPVLGADLGAALFWHAHGEPSTSGHLALAMLVAVMNGDWAS